jgi:hypothetical protein
MPTIIRNDRRALPRLEFLPVAQFRKEVQQQRVLIRMDAKRSQNGRDRRKRGELSHEPNASMI